MLSAIAIAFLVELLRGEYCINAVDGINNSKMLRMQFPLIPLFHILWVILFCGPRLLLCGPYYTVTIVLYDS